MKNLVPKSLSRAAHLGALKVSAKSPTILVVSGVVGLTATAVLAARATRNLDPVVEAHQKGRAEIGYVSRDNTVMRREQQRQILGLYVTSARKLARIYGPTIVVGTLSAGSVLYGHKILKGRHVASLAAYSGLQDQFLSYRNRVAKTLGSDLEKDIYDGAHAEWEEDPERKGEYKLKAKWEDPAERAEYYLRPYFDEQNIMWRNDPEGHYMVLKGIQNHFNNKLQIQGYVMLCDVYDALKLEKTRETYAAGWLRDSKTGDGHIDFGFMTSNEPDAVAFRNFQSPDVRLNFNVDGLIWDLID